MNQMLSTTSETAIPMTGEWGIDPSHTQVGFAVKHLMISTVRGRFADVAGTVKLDDAGGTATVDVTIAVDSITTNDAKRDAHLRSADFFDAENHPVIRFTADRVDGDRETRFTLSGILTIRGVSRPVTLDVLTEGRVSDPWGNPRLGFSATARLNRKDFGLTWNMGLEAGGVLVGDEVQLTIEAELVKR